MRVVVNLNFANVPEDTPAEEIRQKALTALQHAKVEWYVKKDTCEDVMVGIINVVQQ